MKSRIITTNIHDKYPKAGDAKHVEVRDYNKLKEDFDDLRPSDTGLNGDTISEVTAAAGVTIDTNVLVKDGNITMTNTDAGAALGPELTLYRNSASPAASDIAGVISFDGEDSAGNTQEYGAITSTIEDATSTSEDGSLQLKVTVAGTPTEIVEVHGTGMTVAGNVRVGAGAVGTPSVAVNAADTGLYYVSSIQTGFAQDGVLIAAFNSASQIGLQADYVTTLGPWGTTPVGTVAITEYGDGRDMTTRLVLTNFIIGTIPGAGNLGIGNIVYAFPSGQHIELAASFTSLVLTIPGTAVATETGLGSVIASTAITALNGTATFEDRLTGQVISTAAGGGAAVSALTACTAGVLTGIGLNVAGSVKNVFLNSAGAWNANNAGNLTASGTIYLKWTRM